VILSGSWDPPFCTLLAWLRDLLEVEETKEIGIAFLVIEMVVIGGGIVWTWLLLKVRVCVCVRACM